MPENGARALITLVLAVVLLAFIAYLIWRIFELTGS